MVDVCAPLGTLESNLVGFTAILKDEKALETR